MADLGAPFLQGAEARLYRAELHGRACVVKERFVKAYRHPQLDAKLNGRRLQQEVRALVKARRAGVAVPAVLLTDTTRYRIWMDAVPGSSLKEALLAGAVDKEAKLAEVGAAIARLHGNGIVHGDLTTSNMMVHSDTGRIVMIDFGLASTGSQSHEDKAVDLYVLERAIASTHPDCKPLFDSILLKAYLGALSAKQAKLTMTKLEDVRQRGRKRTMLG